jgi:molecular chaperone GrpE
VSEESQQNTAEENGSAPDTAETVASVREQCEAEKAELQERVLRAQAEFQNFRRRADKERLELSEYSSMEAVRTLLPIIDDFKRALGVESADKEYAKGMELIEQRLSGVLQKLGLEPVEAAGQIFDPHVHHAVEMVETDEAPDQTVLAEFQRGYNFKGRLLRAAMVKVAVNPQGK